jgi:hypothetical protein
MVKFDYPEVGWSTGKMRKRGEKPEPKGEQYAMDLTRRGQPDSGMLTEMDRAAGFGLTARGASTARAEVTRGAGGLNPEIIQAYKAQTQGFGQPWEVGTMNKVRNRRKGATRADPEGLDVYDAMDVTTMPVELLTGKPASEWNHKVLELAATLHEKYSRATGATEILGKDENLNPKKIPINEWDPSEQASRTMKKISANISIGGKGNRISIGEKKAAEQEWEE